MVYNKNEIQFDESPPLGRLYSADEIQFDKEAPSAGLSDKAEIPRFGQAPEPSAWEGAKETARHGVRKITPDWFLEYIGMQPDINGEEAVLALVDSEMINKSTGVYIPPSQTYEHREYINKYFEDITPAKVKAMNLRSTAFQRVKQAWEIGAKQDQRSELAWEYIINRNAETLKEYQKLQMQKEEEIFIPQNRLEDAVMEAAKMIPMMADTAIEGGVYGLGVGTGFATIAAIAGQPELILPSFKAGLSVGGTYGAFNASMRKEGGFVIADLLDKGVDPDIAASVGLPVGIINGALEFAQIKTLLKTMPGAEKILKKSIAETLMNKTLKNRLAQLALEYPKTVLKETGQEITQESVSILFEEIGITLNNNIKGTDISQSDAVAIKKRLEDVSIASLKSFLVIGGVPIVLRAGSEIVSREDAKMSSKQINLISEIEKQGGQIEGITKDKNGNLENVIVSKENTIIPVSINASPDIAITEMQKPKTIEAEKPLEQPEVKKPTHKEIVDSFTELSDEDMAKRVEELIPAPHEALLEPSPLKEPPSEEVEAKPISAPIFEENTTVQGKRMSPLMGANDNIIVAKNKTGKELGYIWYTKEPDGGFTVRKTESFVKRQGIATALTNEVVVREGVKKGFTDVTPEGLAFSKAYAEKYPQNVSPELKQRLTEISAERGEAVLPELKLEPTELPNAKPKPAVQPDLIKVQPEMPKTAIETKEAGHPMLEEITKREEEKRQLAIPELKIAKQKKAIVANPETDSLATYIRKNGGFNYQKKYMKGKLDRLSKKEAGTTGLISKSGKGYTLDQMLEKAIEDGYFNENATINNLLDALENEVYMKKKYYSTMKVWTDAELGEMMMAGMVSEEKSIGSLLTDLNDAIGEAGVIGKGGADISKVMPILSKIGNKIYTEGHKTYEQFSNRMKKISGTAYSKIKDYLYMVWQAVKQFNERLGERGAIGISKEERIALKEKGFSDKQISAMTNKEMNKLFPKREQIRETTGQVKDEELVNLRYAFIKAGQAAREAFRAGKIEVAEQEKQKLVNILDRSKKINAVRDYFGLTDAEMKKVSRRNPLLMSQYEFKIYLDNVRQKALEMAENSFEKSRIMYHIFSKDLKKVNNYRMALELPPITKMTTEQAAQFADLLEPFQEGDEFLTLRELETVDRTDLAGIRTWREAREGLAKETGIPVKELNKIKVTEFDKYRWDAVLVERNPFYKMMVTETTKKLLEGNLRIHDIENKVFELARKSQKSKKRSLLERAIPQDKEIIEYLEAPMEDKEAIGKEMTPEQLDYANYIQTYFRNALEYLIKENALEKGRENYFVHVRRSFFENAKEAGLIKAVKDIFKSYQEDMATFQILDKDTGNILPLEKFFQFALHRSDVIEPSANATKAFLTYVKTFEKKISLDEIIPKIDIYAQSLTPQKLTPRGLEKDRSIKTFVNEYINNKKGRRIDQMVGKQGGVIDVGIRAAKTFTTLLDLGLNIPVGLTSYVGESVTNFISLGIKKHALGAIRDKTKKGRAIVKKYEAWTDRSIWENFKAPGKEIQERFSDALFGLFHQSMVDANRHFILGSLTKEEWNSGELNSKRLAELQLEMGRWRVVPGTKSLVGSTALGSALMQYKTWAAPIISTTVKDISTLITDLKSKSVGEALTIKEAREIYRIIGITSTILIAGAMATADDDDKSFIGQLLSKAYRESLTLLQGVDPSLWLATPRILGFLTELGKNLHALILLKEYKIGKKKGELKGVKGLEKQITPRAIKQFQEKEKK